MEKQSEVEDMSAEFQRERDDLLETIREQNKELKLLEQVLEMILPRKEPPKAPSGALAH